MTVNVYFTSSLITSITATIAARTFNSKGINILVSETPVFSQSSTYFLCVEYWKIKEIINSFFNWSGVINLNYDRQEPSVRSDFFKSLKYIHYIKSFKRTFNDKLAQYGKIEQVFAPGNSLFWPLIYESDTKYSFIEHGVGEYNMIKELSKRSPFQRIKKNINRKRYELIGYPINSLPSRVVCTDGNRSRTTLGYDHCKCRCELVSIDSREIVRDMLKYFETEFKNRFPSAYCELDEIKRLLCLYPNKYLYLPTEEVPNNEYPIYLKEQIKRINANDVCFVVKNWPAYRNKRDYSEILKKIGITPINLNSKANAYMPAEFLSAMLGHIPLFGSYSSSLLFSYWWFGVKPIFAEVREHPVNNFLLKIYGYLSDDFRNL